MMIYSGSPIPILREDLLNTDDDEKVVAANNFYVLLCSLLLFPTAIAVVVLLASSHIIDFNALMTEPTLASLMGALFVGGLVVNQILILKLQVFLKKAQNANKDLLDRINRRHEKQ